MIVEREHKIQNHVPVETFKVVGDFTSKGINFKAELVSGIFISYNDAKSFLELAKGKEFYVKKLPKSCLVKNSISMRKNLITHFPFITSTLQQEASRVLGFNVSRTMSVAQRLYESGRITYMRTEFCKLN